MELKDYTIMDYKEILKGIVNIINTAEKSDIGFANICTYIGENCPELAESEDERIRKEILEFVTIVADSKSNKMEWITWLEKQGEPMWTEEDERGSDETIELLEYFINYAPEFRKPAIGRSIAWLKSLKQRLGGEQ